jgi:hypothetical protein
MSSATICWQLFHPILESLFLLFRLLQLLIVYNSTFFTSLPLFVF